MAATPLRASRALTPGDWDGSERASERASAARDGGGRRRRELSMVSVLYWVRTCVRSRRS